MRAVILMFSLTACSFFATEGPKPPPGPTACNRDSKPVLGDAIATLGAAFAAGVATVAQSGGVEAPVALGVAGVFGVSTAYGWTEVRRCRAEHAKRPGWSLAEMPAVM